MRGLLHESRIPSRMGILCRNKQPVKRRINTLSFFLSLITSLLTLHSTRNTKGNNEHTTHKKSNPHTIFQQAYVHTHSKMTSLETYKSHVLTKQTIEIFIKQYLRKCQHAPPH